MPVSPAASGSEMAAYTTGVLVSSAHRAEICAAVVAMGMMASTLSAMAWSASCFSTVWSSWPEVIVYLMVTFFSAASWSRRAATAPAISSREAWSSCLMMATVYSAVSPEGCRLSGAWVPGFGDWGSCVSPLEHAHRDRVRAAAAARAKSFFKVLCFFMVCSSKLCDFEWQM